MAEFDDQIVQQIKDLLNASKAASSKGLASQATLEAISVNIAALAKKAGAKGISVEEQRAKKATKETKKESIDHIPRETSIICLWENFFHNLSRHVKNLLKNFMFIYYSLK